MSRARDEHSLGRSLAAITIGAVKSSRSRESGLDPDRLREIEQQFQVPIRGEAGAIVATGFVDLAFTHYFIDAPLQRENDLPIPQFTYGVVLRTDQPIIISACVVGWDEDNDRGEIRGARVGLAVAMPDVSFSSLNTDLIAYDGELHATFQGFGFAPQPEQGDDF